VGALHRVDARQPGQLAAKGTNETAFIRECKSLSGM
jgi:hypothetical protein